MMGDADPLHHPFGMDAGRVGKNQFASRQPGQAIRQGGICGDDAEIDLVNVIEERRRIDAVFDHQATHRRAVTHIEFLLPRPGRIGRDIEIFGDKGGHAQTDQVEQPRRCRIEGIVEIENPVFDFIEKVVGHQPSDRRARRAAVNVPSSR